MTGDAATELLREVAQLAAVRIPEWESEASFQEFADAILALPSVRRLLADRQTVQRVEALAEEFTDRTVKAVVEASKHGDGSLGRAKYVGRGAAYGVAAFDLRRALGGAQ